MIKPSTLVDFAAWLPHSTFTDPEEAATWWLENVYKSPADQLDETRRINRVGRAADYDSNCHLSADVLYKAMTHPKGQYIICAWVPNKVEGEAFTHMGASSDITKLPGVISRYAIEMNQPQASNLFIRILNALSIAARTLIDNTLHTKAKNN